MFTTASSWRWWVFRAVALVAVLIIGGGAAFAGYQLLGPEISTTKTSSSTTGATRPTPLPTAPRAPEPDSEPPIEPDGNWRAAAITYGEAFVNTSGGIEAWRARMSELVSPSMVQGYSYTDLTAIPVEKLVETSTEEIEVAGETPSRMVRLFYTGGLIVDITVSWDPTLGGRGWVITTAVDVADPDQTPLPAPPPAEGLPA